MLRDVGGILLIASPLLVTLAIGRISRVGARRAPRLALSAAGAQLACLVATGVLLEMLPREGNRQGGTCASFRRSELDEVVAGLGWTSAIAGGLALAGSLAAARPTNTPGRWYALAVGSVALPYVIFVWLYGTGLCYALDT